METSVRLLPLLPELLIDLPELGAPVDEIVSALKAAGIRPGSKVLDLGCGKGAVAVGLAERLGLHVEGIDAFRPFLESARALAVARGVHSNCLFREGDIRDLLGGTAEYDAVLLLSVGPVSGDHRKTVADLRTLARPGGWIVIEDGFLADGVAIRPEWEGYSSRTETLRCLTASGDELIREVVFGGQETRALNERNTALIRNRARLLKKLHPELEDEIAAYVARQERETEILGAELICALWVLRRV